MNKLAPYGSLKNAMLVAKVGGTSKAPASLADRLPAVELIAKVGDFSKIESRTLRVVRLNKKA